MSKSNVHCLMVSGPSLTDAARNILFDSAQEMIRKGKTRKKVKGGDFEGLVTTNGQVALMGTVAGYIFKAEIEGVTNKVSKVDYVIRPTDVLAEDGSWYTWDSVPTFDPRNN